MVDFNRNCQNIFKTDYIRNEQISKYGYITQKNFKEITAADEIDKKTLAKMKKNAARDADIIQFCGGRRLLFLEFIFISEYYLILFHFINRFKAHLNI